MQEAVPRVPAPRSPRPSRRLGALTIAGVLLVVCGGYWLQTTRPVDPLVSTGGFLGLEGMNVGPAPIGRPAPTALIWYLVGRNGDSRTTVSGVTLPHIEGLRLRLFRVTGRLYGGGEIGIIRRSPTSRGDISWSQLQPLVGSHLQPPADQIPFALVVTATRPGCYAIRGPLSIHYLVGGTTFTRSLDGPIHIWTKGRRRSCAG